MWLIDNNDNTVVEYYYDAWGNHKVVDANGDEITDLDNIGNLNPFRYRGYYYDPEVGRFLNRDSVQYADPETINGLNLYAYCLNNPVEYVDPTGSDPQWWQWLLFGIGAVLVAASIIALPFTAGGSGLISAIITGAAKGALIGAAVGSGIGIAGGAIYSGVTGSDMGESILSGFLMGFGIGAVVGAVVGGTVGGLSYTTSGLSRRAISKGIKSLNNNDLHHIINKSEHALNKVLTNVNERSVKQLIKKTLIKGTVQSDVPLKVVLTLANGNPTVTGMIVDGIVRIGTFFIM